MRCCVAGCKNDSRHLSKSHGITFHVFPVESSSRTLWLRAVGKDSWEPKERSTVCSDHFQSEDLYETKSGLRRVRSGAVPFVNEAALVECEEEEVMKVCRICLATDTRLLSLKKHKLERAFFNITGFTLQSEEAASLGGGVCPWCLARLRAASELRARSRRAHALLASHSQMTIENIKEIDRIENDLTLNLSVKHFGPDHSDSSVLHEGEAEEAGEREVVAGVDIKEEAGDDANEIFIDETQFNEDLDDDVKEEGHDTHRDDNFVVSDGDYSTDDSLPLERRRTKSKERTEKKKSKKKSKKSKRPKEPKVDRRRKPFLNEDLNETLFTITDLTFEEQMAEILKRQESANYKNSAFKCTFCYKGFLDEDAYNGHIVKHTRQCGEYACAVCKTHFRQPHPLRKHITAHHTQRYSCNRCPYVTTHRQTARLHERWHKGTKYKCPHCQDEFLKFTTYMGHVRIKHPSHFVCELCGNSFVSEKGIELHKKLKHRLDDATVPPDGPYCDTCDVRFVSAEAHLKHLQASARHADTEKKPKENRGAEKRTRKEASKERRDEGKSRSEARPHPSQVRKAEGPIACEQCGIQLEDSRAYHGHFRRMHPDKNRTQYPSMRSPCMCEVCGRLFQSRALLRDHRWTHTGERPFACGECGKSFRMRQRLVAHRRVHAAQKPRYACAACGKHFTTHSNRQRHMFIHTGLKPFACEMCGKCFKHASEKRAHVTYVHLKKPWPKRARAKRRGPATAPAQDAPNAWPAPDGAHQMNDKALYYDLKM